MAEILLATFYLLIVLYLLPVVVLTLLAGWDYGFKTVFIGTLQWPVTLAKAVAQNFKKR